jgi:hypothetical protein
MTSASDPTATIESPDTRTAFAEGVRRIHGEDRLNAKHQIGGTP